MARWWRRKPFGFADEIQSHLDLDADELIGEGAQPKEARTAARRRFGNVTAAQERFYESGRFLAVDRISQDIRGALRAIRRHPLVYAVAILSLAAGIGSTTASLAIRDTVFRNPPPLYQKPDDLSNVFTITPRGFRRGVPAALYAIWLKQRDAAQAWAAARSARRSAGREATYSRKPAVKLPSSADGLTSGGRRTMMLRLSSGGSAARSRLVQTCASMSPNQKRSGMTPMTVYGRSATQRVRPITSARPSNNVCHTRFERTTDDDSSP